MIRSLYFSYTFVNQKAMKKHLHINCFHHVQSAFICFDFGGAVGITSFVQFFPVIEYADMIVDYKERSILVKF